MPTSWRVVLNSTLWNQAKFEKSENRMLAQSKGACRMVTCPKKGDNVSFVLKGKIVMKGIVESDGFVIGIDHKKDSCNLGEHRIHALTNEFAWIKITEIGLSIDIRPTGQRTWAKMPV